MSERAYRLNPPDRTGWFLGLGGPQVITLVLGLVAFVAIGQAGDPGGTAPVALLSAAVLALGRSGGRPLVECLPSLWRWTRTGGAGSTWLARVRAFNGSYPTTPNLPPPLADQVIVAIPGDHPGGEMAVVIDDTAGTCAASLRVAGRQFALVERAEQDSLLALWGDVLAAFCREGGPVVEVRWSEWAAPAGMEEQHAYLADHGVDDPTDPALVSYRQLLAAASPVATRHEVLVTVVVSASKLRAGRRGDRTAGAVEALREELRLLSRRLEAAGLAASAPLRSNELARALRVRLDPSSIAVLGRRGRSLGDRAGLVAPADGGPLVATATHRHWQVDGTYHRAFHFREWPRHEVGPNWMADLLLFGDAVRTFTVCCHPVPARVSQRTIARQAAKIESEAAQRRRGGFRVGAHHRRAELAVAEREEELVAGYAELEYVGLLDVAAPNLETLERACSQLVQLSAGAGVELRPLHGRHAAGVAACLPLALGLAQRALTP